MKQVHGHRRQNENSLLCSDCDFSGWYNSGRITKIVATRCHILNLKCTKFVFGKGSAPDPAGELTALPETLWLGLRGLLLRGGREEEGKRNSGCRNAIHSVRKTVERLTKGNNTVNICSLDLSKAFDKVNHYGLGSTY